MPQDNRDLNELLKTRLEDIFTELEFKNLIDLSFDSFSDFPLLKGLKGVSRDSNDKEASESLLGIYDKALIKDFIFVFALPLLSYFFRRKGSVFLSPSFLFFLTNSSSFIYKAFAKSTIEQIMDTLNLKSTARSKAIEMIKQISSIKSISRKNE